MGSTGAIFVLPSVTAGQQGPVAGWVSTAGWASAARVVLGESWIVTPAGPVDADEARRRASLPYLSGTSSHTWRRRLPAAVKTAVKDVRDWRRGRQFRVETDGPWNEREIAFVWQRHELFHTAGLDLARSLAVPSVLFVHAALVWQATQWGVGRPGRKRWLERFGERPSMLAADLVACGSEPVAAEMRRLGVGDERIIITPTGVDLGLFADPPDSELLRRRLGLTGRFVVGWVGSFRRFHALEQAIDAVSGIDDGVLLMVGDGPERGRIERLAHDRGVAAVFTGTVPHAELPALLAAMDVALVLAPPDQIFHYSPLKLAEYLAAGLPVVAPRLEQLAERLTDGVDAVLVPPGDAEALAAGLRDLHDDSERRHRIGAAARVAAEDRWSWDHAIRQVLSALRRASR